MHFRVGGRGKAKALRVRRLSTRSRGSGSPDWVGYTENAHSLSGRDYKGGSGLKRGDNCTRRVSRQTASGLA